jgi:phospholipase A1
MLFVFKPLPNYLSLVLLVICFAKTNAQSNSLFAADGQKTMSQLWELDSVNRQGTFIISPYKPVYILPARWSSNPNGQPESGNSDPDYEVDENEHMDHFEAKFQLSFKVKIIEGVLYGNGDLWCAYTQKAHWQLYNESLSRPFREINYEPEVILNFHTNYELFGFNGKMAGIAFNHQSNGRDYPLSRSWNRIIVHAGFEKTNWQAYLRAWYRLPDDQDDNPDIVKYIGSGDATVIYHKEKDIFSLVLTPSFNFSDGIKGSADFTWAHTIKGNLKGHLQITCGYGETLIDYNNFQTTIGLGVSLIEWL